MGLEHNQRLDNDVKVHAGNISASNDSSQWIHDSNELTNGAKFWAAAKELGLSEEETIQLASRKRQRQTPESAAVQNAFMDAFDARMPAELDGVRFQDDESWAFGQDQSEFQNFTGNDYEFEAGPNGSLQRKSWADDKDPIYGTALRRRFEENKYGQRVVTEKEVPGEIMGFSSDAAPEQRSNADMRALIDQERQRARRTADSDSARYSTIRAIENQLAAEAEATAIARDQRLSMNSALADAALAREGFQTVPSQYGYYPGMESAAMVNGVYADPKTGEPLAVQGPAEPLAKSNTPNTNQQLNAPQTSREWIGSHLPEFNRDGSYPQVDISGTTALFSQRLAPVLQGLGVDTTNLSGNVRSLAEVERAVDTVVRLSGEKGKKLYDRSTGSVPGTTKSVASSNPGLEQVLNAMRYSDVEKAQLANALNQLALQEQSSVNQEATRRYQSRSERAFPDGDITFDAPPGGRGVQGARIPAGRRIEGSTIVSQLRGLDGRASGQQLSQSELADARSPRQGLAIGQDGKPEAPRIDRRVAPGSTSIEGIAAEKRSRMERYAAKSGKPVDEAALKRHTTGAQLAFLRQQKADQAAAAARSDRPRSMSYQPQAVPGLAYTSEAQQPKQRPAITSQPDGPTNDRGVRGEIVRRLKLGRDMRATALGVGGGVMALAGINGLMNRDQGGL